MARKQESTLGENLAKQIIKQYNPKSVADIQNAFYTFFGLLVFVFAKAFYFPR